MLPSHPALLSALALSLTLASCSMGRSTGVTSPGPGAPAATQAVRVRSHVTIIDWDGTGKREIYSAESRLEAPNWSPDGRYLVLNGDGKLFRLSVEGLATDAGELQEIPLGSIGRINNDHGISPDGRRLVVSQNGGPLYLVPFEGGDGPPLSPHRPSYYHGWSPDGEWLAYVARDSGQTQYDLFRVRVSGGDPERLTATPAHEDGPDYSPDGRWIYFNSDRAGGPGTGNIWRMPGSGELARGGAAERITRDDLVDWFPHPSPDGRWLIFLSYPKGTEGHPANRDVVLRRMPLPGSEPNAPIGPIEEVVRLFGGQGTINVASWAPDGRRFAYVSYSLVE